MSDKKHDHRKGKKNKFENNFSNDGFAPIPDYTKPKFSDQRTFNSIPERKTYSNNNSGNIKAPQQSQQTELSQQRPQRPPVHSGDKDYVSPFNIEQIIDNQIQIFKFIPFPDRKPADKKIIRILLMDGSIVTECVRRQDEVLNNKRIFLTSDKSKYSENFIGNKNIAYYSDDEVKGWWYTQ